MKFLKNKKFLIRFGVYTLVFLFAVYVADLVEKNLQFQRNLDVERVFQIKVSEIWGMEKNRVDKINKAVSNYVSYYKLEPGAFLPPKTFFKENSIWEDFNHEKESSVIQPVLLEGQNSQTYLIFLRFYSGSVPEEEGQPYFVSALIASSKLLPGGFDICPKDQRGFSFRKVAKVYRETENAGKDSGN